ncbi:MAG: nucleotidyltransferase family protein [Gemmatimonadales bacterium]
MTPALQLFLALLRRDATREIVAAFDAEAWSGLLAAAPRELHPYIAWRLLQLVDGAQLPAGIIAPLELARRSAMVGHLPRQAVLRRLAHALDEAGIPFVVLKGAALAYLAYPEPALRGMGDIDIWTRAEFLDRTTEVLIGAGMPYSARMAVRRATASPMEQDTTRVFEATGTSVVVELHGEVRSMLAVAPAWSGAAWARATPCDLGGIRARVLHAEDMLTHLAVHASAHHHFEMGLRPLLDIAMWLEREGASCDWCTLGERWRESGCFTWCYLTVALARELMAVPLPADFLGNVVAPVGFEEMHALARTQVLDSASSLPHSLARLATTPTTGGRWRWVLHRLTTWYWRGPPGIPRTPLEMVRQATIRMSGDLRTKLPPYLRGWRDGSLRGAEFRRRQALALGRQRLTELVRQAEGAGRGG